MKKQTILILIFNLYIGHFLTFSQTAVLNENCQKAYNAILCLQLESADSILNKEENLNKNAYVPYLKNYNDFVSLFVTQNTSLYKKLKDQRSNHFQKVESLNEDSPYRNWMLGNMHLQWAVLKIMFGDYVSAAFDFNTAYNLIEKNKFEHPGFHLNNLSESVLKIIVGLVPEQYNWFINLLSMEGNVSEGKTQLENFLWLCKTNADYTPYYGEALFYASFIEMNIYPDEKQLKYYINEANHIDDSVLLITFLRINLYMRTGENQNALNLLNKTHNYEVFSLPFAYLNYLNAECLLRAGDWYGAIEKYNLFLSQFEGDNYVKDAWRKKAWAAAMLDDKTMYDECMEKVLKKGVSRIGIDKDALTQATKENIPNRDLLLSQILFDGGYYSQSLSLLKNMDTAAYLKEEKVIYVYRLARVYHKMGMLEKAKHNYVLTILKGENLNSYYAANAALKLGEIYESEGEFISAREAYIVCGNMKYDQYRNSISRRAKEGLKRLQNRQ